MAGSTRYGTAVKAAELVHGRYSDTAGKPCFLDAAREAHGALGLQVFGGDAAVSQAAIDACRTGEDARTPDAGGGSGQPVGLTAGTCGGSESEPVRRLSDVPKSQDPAWSPDCTRVVYSQYGSLYTAATDGTGARALIGLSDSAFLEEPAWSPDGTQIAFSRYAGSGRDENGDRTDPDRRIVVMAADGGDPMVLDPTDSWERRPMWSPDGQFISFTHYDQTGPERDFDDTRFASVVGARSGTLLEHAVACRPLGLIDNTTAGFPLPDWAPSSRGTVRVAVLFVDFADAQADHTTGEEAARGLPWAEEYLEKMSYSKLDVEFDFSGFHSLAVILPSTHFSGGSAGGAIELDGVRLRQHVNNNARRDEPVEPTEWGGVGAHELVHSLGLLDMYAYDAGLHALPELVGGDVWVTVDMGLMGLNGYFAADAEDPRLGHEWRYADSSRQMARFSYLTPLEMLSWSRWQLGWLSETQVSCVTDDKATVRLGPVAGPGAETAMAAIPLNSHEVIVIESRRQIGYDAPDGYVASSGATTEFPTLITPGVVVYTVDSFVESGRLPVKFAGDSGNGQVNDFPVLVLGESVTLRGCTITVTADDGDTHTVSIARES